MRVDAPDPGLQARIAVAERLVLDEDAVEEVVVTCGEPQHGVLEERESDAVRGTELAEEIVAAREQRLEALECGAHVAAELLHLSVVRLCLLELGGHDVRW